jgi:hypothetical protein
MAFSLEMNQYFEKVWRGRNVGDVAGVACSKEDRLWTLQVRLSPRRSGTFSTMTQCGMIRTCTPLGRQVRPTEALFTL